VLESPIGEEAQVAFGKGAPTLYHNGKYRRPWLFCMTLKYSGKAFRKVVWKADQQTWARLHEEAFRAFGGSVEYVVLDNLKQGVISPDLYEPQYNPVYLALLSHYNSAADAARVADPDRKGAIESTIKHTQNTALKGRKFNCIEDQNAWLAHCTAKSLCASTSAKSRSSISAGSFRAGATSRSRKVTSRSLRRTASSTPPVKPRV